MKIPEKEVQFFHLISHKDGGGCVLFLTADGDRKLETMARHADFGYVAAKVSYEGRRGRAADRVLAMVRNRAYEEELLAFGMVMAEQFHRDDFLFVDRLGTARLYRVGSTNLGGEALGPFTAESLSRFYEKTGRGNARVDNLADGPARIRSLPRYAIAEILLSTTLRASPLGAVYRHVGKEALAFLAVGEADLGKAVELGVGTLVMEGTSAGALVKGAAFYAPAAQRERLYHFAAARSKEAGKSRFLFVYPDGAAYEVSVKDTHPTAFPTNIKEPPSEKGKRYLGAFSLDTVWRFYGEMGKRDFHLVRIR